MRQPGKRLWAILAAADLAALALAGCSGDGGGGGSFAGIGPSTVGYQHSNAIAKSGYSESQIAPDRYRIEVRGPLSTPRERLEMIAATRAAEIGRDNRLGYFKIDGMQLASECQRYKTGGKPGNMGSGVDKAIGHVLLTAEVAYTKSPPDQSYRDSKSFDQLRAELDQAPVVPSLPDPSLAGQCS